MMDSIFKASGVGGGGKKAEIVAALRAQITDGTLQPGDRLTGARKVGEAFGCSGAPYEGARKQLVKEGLVEVRNGQYFVAGTPSTTSETPADPLKALENDLSEPPKDTAPKSLADLDALIDGD